MATMSSTDRRRFDACFAAVRSIAPEAIIDSSNRHAYNITMLKKGSVFRYDRDIYLVNGVATYKETSDDFTKERDCVVTELTLFSLTTGETRYIEWEKDDTIEVCFTTAKVKARDLRSRLTYDDGSAVNVDDDADDWADDQETLVFLGKSYDYVDDWAARYQSDDGRTHYAYFYEFEADDGTYLTVEAWSETGKEGGAWDYEVYISVPVGSSEIEVISLGE